jgi:hypothetical protein
MNELKRLDYKCKEFTANGKKYYVSDTLSVERYIMFEIAQAEIQSGLDLFDIKTQLQKAIDYGNAGKGIDGWTIIKNLNDNIAKSKENIPAQLKLAALFFNYEGEDIRVYDEQVQMAKIQDWQKEGYDVASFFFLAEVSALNFLKSCNGDLADILQEQKELKEILESNEPATNEAK